MDPTDKIVLEHAGALGDFLLAWPALLSLARHFPGLARYFAVPSAHAPWLSPLAAPCPPDLRRGLDARFAGETWPAALARTLVVRPGLGKRPDLPDWQGFWFLPGLAQGRDASPTDLYREALQARGIPFVSDYRNVFQTLFEGHAPSGDMALLFPGAGSPDKAWPLSRFESLADMLRSHGVRPLFIIGPVERERGLRPSGEVLAPESLDELSAAIRAARFVVGPDCGPLHLAGMHGVPGVVLFGPTSPHQWQPLGLEVVRAGLLCSPCTVVTSKAFARDCPRPLPCLEAITVEMVWRRLRHADLIPG